MRQGSETLVVALLASSAVASSFSPRRDPLRTLNGRQDVAAPIVDLGYAVHQATVNTTAHYYRFGNIRFAEAPLGDLRFAAPVPPQSVDRKINTGEVDYQCPSASPAWTVQALSHMYYGAVQDVPPYKPVTELPDTAPIVVQEDCLFLDVLVPEKVFDDNKAAEEENCQCTTKNPNGVPVVVYIQGGSFTIGSKNTNGNPSGLMIESMRNDNPGMIYVSINYRLGLFGWLPGDKFKSEGGTPNAGFYDQQLAFEWVKTYIHLFGGDPDRVTLMGLSSGSGSIMHHMTSYGGKGTGNFNQAFLQSPAFTIVAGKDQQEDVYSQFLAAAGVANLAEARGLSSGFLQLVNINTIGAAPYGSQIFGPVIDGTFVTDYPGALLLEGSYNHDIKVFLGHTVKEGDASANIYVTNETGLVTNLQGQFPHMSAADLATVTTDLYPAVYDGTYSYTTIFDRLALIIAEADFVCNEYYVAKAYADTAYSYYMDISPGYHGFDIGHTFYSGPSADAFGNVIDPTLAKEFQDLITTFIMHGDPNADGLPTVPIYSSTAQQASLSNSGSSIITDSAANERCLWWQAAPYGEK